jgi:hypothetical protein
MKTYAISFSSSSGGYRGFKTYFSRPEAVDERDRLISLGYSVSPIREGFRC